jgi:hypothetical protein
MIVAASLCEAQRHACLDWKRRTQGRGYII